MAKNSTSTRVTFRIKPPKGEPPNAQVYYEAIGRVITAWGSFETAWEHIMDAMLGVPGSDVAFPRSINAVPGSFDKRCELWTNLFTQIPAFIQHKEYAVDLLERAKDPFRVRSIFGHSAFNGFVNNDPLTGTFVNRRHKRGQVIQSVYDLNLPKLLETLNVIGGLKLALLPLVLDQVSLQPLSKVEGKPHRRRGAWR